MAKSKIGFTMRAESGNAARAFMQLEKTIDAGEKSLKRMSQSGKGAGTALTGVTKAVGGLSVLAAAGGVLALFTSAARAAHAEIKGMAEEFQGFETTFMNLWQVADDKSDYIKMRTDSMRAAIQEGTALPESGAAKFELKSRSREEARDAVMASSRFMAVETAAKFYTTVTDPANWGQKWEDPAQVFSAAIAGAKASAFNIPQTAKYTIGVGPQAAELGATLPETLALGAAISGTTDTPEILRTRVKSMARGLEKAGYGSEYEGGWVAGFEAFRQEKPEEYAKAKKSEKEFGLGALALEKSLDSLEEKRLVIAEALKSDALFLDKLMTPEDMTIMRESRKAAAQKMAMAEPLMDQQRHLTTSIDRNKALALAAGESFTMEKLWEKGLEEMAPFGLVEEATQLSDERIIERLVDNFPGAYTKHLAPHLGRHPGQKGGWGGMLTGLPPYEHGFLPDLPETMTPEIRAAIASATQAATEQTLDEREQRKLEALEENNRLLEERNRQQGRENAHPQVLVGAPE